MKCHDCRKTMSRSEIKKHVCHPYKSVGLSAKARLYLKRFGSKPSKKAG